MTLANALGKSFLGNSPGWYKATVLGFLILNPVLLIVAGPFAAGWALVIEFIFALGMALKCYPLQPGGLLALEAVFLGMADTETVYRETAQNFPVILLLMFMVAGIYFMKDLLLLVFSKVLLTVRSKTILALMFCGIAAALSAFLDALTVIAVIITVATGFYAVYHRIASGATFEHDHDHSDDAQVSASAREDLNQFRAFLRNLMMHAGVGTALGGVITLVGEPQNLLIGHIMEWNFGEFFLHAAPVTLPVLAVGLFTCFLTERLRLFSYGAQMPGSVRQILEEYHANEMAKLTPTHRLALTVQAAAAIALVAGLALHVAEVGLIGLSVIVAITALTGITEEGRLAHAFEAAMPFTALLVVFFAIVAVIHEQHLFQPIVDWALTFQGSQQLAVFYLATGLLSAVSDNVFVATVYIGEASRAFQTGAFNREHFDLLAVAINTGTNIPSIATPNGQAAFLFLLTSALAPLIRLSYGRMVWMALPYTITITTTGLIAVLYLL